ncbi:MAG: acyl-ACP--UDP-N-acetylglucosamine O-acyltransferase [Phycisphaerales bacterium]
MATVHPTAIVEGDVRLADDVTIGPHCVLRAPAGTSIVIGRGSRLMGQSWIEGPAVLGTGNTVYPFVTLGFSPQDLKWDPADAGAGVTIGDANVFREGASIHRATSRTTPTIIGNSNYFMANSHAGHDARIGNNCIFANGTLLAGHVVIGDRVVTGGNVCVHQFCRIARGCMLSGAVATGRDLPPFVTLTGLNIVGSLNIVGLRRSGADAETIQHVRWVYKTLYREGVSPRAALPALREREHVPVVREYIEFIESSKRGICPSHGGSGRRSLTTNDGGAEQLEE